MTGSWTQPKTLKPYQPIEGNVYRVEKKMTNKELLKELKSKLDKGAGRNCKEFSHFCFTCSCWDAYDTIKEFLDYSPETDIKKKKTK